MRRRRTRTASALAAGALSVLLGALAVGEAAAPGKSERCSGRQLMADGRSKVVKRDGVFRACRNGRSYWMGAEDEAHGEVIEIALAGRFVAWERAACGQSSTCSGAIIVRDLERGTRRAFPIPLGERPAQDLVVSRSGSVAWIRLGRPDRVTYSELRAADAAGERVLDQGDHIDPFSLAISGRRIYWMSGGQPRTALLSD